MYANTPLSMHDFVNVEGYLCEGSLSDVQREDWEDEMDERGEADASSGCASRIQQVHVSRFNVGRVMPAVLGKDREDVMSGFAYDNIVSVLSKRMGRARAAVLVSWLLGWREGGGGNDIGGVDLIVDGDETGFER